MLMDEQQSTQRPATDAQEFKPGQTISPSSIVPPSQMQPEQATPEAQQASAVPDNSEPPAPNIDTNQQPFYGAQATAQPMAPYADAEDDDWPAKRVPSDDAYQGPITWTASEFIAHEKSANWYGGLAAASLVIAALVYLVTRDKVSTVVVLIAGLSLGFYANRKPGQQRFQLDDQGVTIGQRFHGYGEYRSFAVMDDGAFSSISFMPLKRFGQLTTIYYDPQDEDAIVNLLAARLPMEQRDHDAIDRFMKRIRF